MYFKSLFRQDFGNLSECKTLLFWGLKEEGMSEHSTQYIKECNKYAIYY